MASIFEPHTALIRKGKLGKPTEFGRVVWLDEVEVGIIRRYAFLAGNPDDVTQLMSSLDHHFQRFGHAPKLLVAARKVAGAANKQIAKQRGVGRVVLPHAGRKTITRQAPERQGWFQRGWNSRAGIEGRISGRQRWHNLDRCRYHVDDGMKRWVVWASSSTTCKRSRRRWLTARNA